MKKDAKLQIWEQTVGRIKDEIQGAILDILERNKNVGVTFVGPGEERLLSPMRISNIRKGKSTVEELLETYTKVLPFANPKKKKK